MTAVQVRSTIDVTGARAVLDAGERYARDQVPSSGDRCGREVRRTGRAKAHPRCTGCKLAHGRRQGAESGNLRTPSRELEPLVTAGRLGASAVSQPCARSWDGGGELIFLWRRARDAQVASVGVATGTARTAGLYRRPSKHVEDQASGGRASALHVARAVPLQGGMRVSDAGEVTGAVGVGGASSADEDQELALLGSRALLEAVV